MSIIMSKRNTTIQESNDAINKLMEDMDAGGVYGGVEVADGISNGDNYATGDQRVPKAGKTQSRLDSGKKKKKKKCTCEYKDLEQCNCNVKIVKGKPL